MERRVSNCTIVQWIWARKVYSFAMAFHKRADLMFIKWHQSCWSVNAWRQMAPGIFTYILWLDICTWKEMSMQCETWHSSRIKEREKIRHISATRKTQKSTVANKETEGYGIYYLCCYQWYTCSQFLQWKRSRWRIWEENQDDGPATCEVKI